MKLSFYVRVLGTVMVLFFIGCGRAPEDVSETESSLMNVRIGTFNMLRYGHGTKDDERLAKLILKSKFHVFSGIEIMQAGAAYELRDRLRELSGKPWELSLSKYANGETTYKEFAGFYYRSDVVKPISSAEGYCASNDADAQTFNGCYAVDEGTEDGPSFDRDPYVAQFQVRDRKFAIAAIHVVFGGSDSASIKRRIGELFEFKKVLQKIRDAAQGYNVMAAGDFNLAIDEQMAGQGEVTSTASSSKMPANFFTESPALTGLISEPTTIGLSNYDHVLYLNDNDVKHVSGSERVILDFDLTDPEQKALFKKDVSDHFPAGAKFAL